LDKVHGKTDTDVENKEIKAPKLKEDETDTCGMLVDCPVFVSMLFQDLVIIRQRPSQNEKPSECLRALLQQLPQLLPLTLE